MLRKNRRSPNKNQRPGRNGVETFLRILAAITTALTAAKGVLTSIVQLLSR